MGGWWRSRCRARRSLRLVGAAAQGAEEGEIRPLTIMLGESMRRRCVPGSEAIWGGLRRIEAG